MASSDMRNRRHVQPLLTWSTNAAHLVSLDQEPLQVYCRHYTLSTDAKHLCRIPEWASPALPTDLSTTPSYQIMKALSGWELHLIHCPSHCPNSLLLLYLHSIISGYQTCIALTTIMTV
ncbi:hypothetical protein LAZ67_17001973 [Cordylochernes scorpioides]|uniref:Uncharacterized protein n=1 Tax=Cordylochernes scorpioides TaxID=51811 RepID=A0ABY6LDP1_9ARAC|nr:hypothetical protein LAZ67_17001973 [Cordylochernes scorpioides]